MVQHGSTNWFSMVFIRSRLHCHHPSTRPRHIKAAEHITLQVHCIAFPDFHRSLSLGLHNRSKGRCENNGRT